MLKHYSGNIFIEATKLLAICDGIRFALALSYRTFIVESYAMNAVNTMKNIYIPSSKGNIIVEVLELLKSFGGSSCQFIRRSRNKLAHILAQSFTQFRGDVE